MVAALSLPEAEAALNGEEIAVAVRNRLTARQAKLLDFLRSFTRVNGYPPTMREMGRYMGIRSTNGVNDHLRALERKGVIRRREDGKSRNCVPIDADVSGSATERIVTSWREETAALRTLLEKVQAASARLPHLTAEFVVLLGDVRDALKAGGS